MEQFSNAGQATLSNGGSALTATATTVPFASGVNVPASGTFRILIDSEIMAVTAVSGSNMTVTRGDGGTTATTHSDGSAIYIIVTKEALDAIVNVQSEGTEVSNRRALNFLFGASVADNNASDRADITICGNKYGAGASLPTAGTAGRLYIPSDGVIKRIDTGSVWSGFGFSAPFTPPPAVSTWTWLNQLTTIASDIPGGGIYFQSGQQSTFQVSGLTRPIATPYTLICATSFMMFTQNYLRIGPMLYDSVSGKIIHPCIYYSSGYKIAVERYNSTTSWNSDQYVYSVLQLPPILWFKIVDDGTTRTYYLSINGINWWTWKSEATGVFGTPDHAGFAIIDQNATLPAMSTLLSWSGA